MERLKEFLKTSDINILWEGDNVIWIDCREDDDAIVNCCADALSTWELNSEYVKADNEFGYDFVISYYDKKVTVPFDTKNDNKDIILSTLNKILNPEHEIRFWADTIGGDTLAFVIFSNEDLLELVNEFGEEKINYHFWKIANDSRIFQMTIEEVEKIVKERGL